LSRVFITKVEAQNASRESCGSMYKADSGRNYATA